jgi:proteasome lid subunit RPN8/RPN11
LRIAIEKQPYAAIIGHAVVEPDIEVCGVLVGRVGHDDHGEFLHIDAMIRGEAARQEGAQVTFTHDTWNHIHREMDERYPGREIVGWYHTHGGFGIFLSDMDTFIHKNFFSAPHQVAYVYDPLAGTEGFFHAKGDALELARRYWLGGRERKIVAETRADSHQESTSEQLTTAVSALQRTAASLHAVSVSRHDGGMPFWLIAVLGAAALLAAYTFLPSRVPSVAPNSDRVSPLLVLERRGERAVGLELHDVRRADGVYVDGTGRHFVAVEGPNAAELLDLLTQGRGAQGSQGPPPVPSAVLRRPPSQPGTAALVPSRVVLIGGAVVVALCGALAFFWVRRKPRLKRP